MKNKLKLFAVVTVLAAAIATSVPQETEAALPNFYCLGRYGDCLDNGGSEGTCWANYEGCMCHYDNVGCVV